MQGVDIWRDQLVLAAILLRDQLLDDAEVHAEQLGQHPEADDVLEQLALARVGILLVAGRGQRHADDVDVGSHPARRQRAGVVVDQVAVRLDRGDIRIEGLRVHRDHEIGAAAGAEMTLLVDADFIPGRQALDVRREHVAGRDRHAHPHDGAREHLVGRRRAGAVDVGEADDEIVDGF